MHDLHELLERDLIAASNALSSACELAARLGVRGLPAELYSALACVARACEAVPAVGTATGEEDTPPF